jgi:hypothetical protein
MASETLYGFKSILRFGKYKGKTIEEVLDIDPSYLDWAVGYISGFVLEDEVQRKLELESDAEFDDWDWTE